MGKRAKTSKTIGRARVREITLGFMLSWIIAALFAISALAFIFNKKFIGGFIMLMFAAILLPPLDKFYTHRFHFHFTKGLKIAGGLIGLIVFFIILAIPPPEPPSVCGDYYCAEDESCYDCLTDCGRCREEVMSEIKENIVWVKYEMTGKNQDGSMMSMGGFGSGVIIGKIPTTNQLIIYSNRHVVDCGFIGKCYQKLTEKVTVRTQDGKLHVASAVMYGQHELDLSRLIIPVDNVDKYSSATWSNNPADMPGVGDIVIAVGYPAYDVPGNVLAFSIAEGTVYAMKDLLMGDGFAFASIESDVYTDHGSSGGGLFDTDGWLVGFNTWGNREAQESTAIRADVITSKNFFGCPVGYKISWTGRCEKVCKNHEIRTSTGGCAGRCTSFYCNSYIPIGNDDRCKDRKLVLGTDGYCHKPCASKTRYCESGAICFRNRCIKCEPGNVLYTDGSCAKFQTFSY